MANFPAAVSTDGLLFIAKNNLRTTLALLLDGSQTTVTVTSTTGFPTAGYISVGAEAIKYTGLTSTTFTGCTRGADGTTAAVHVNSSTVIHTNVAAHHNVLKDEVIAIEQFLTDNLCDGTETPLTASRALVSSGAQKISVSAVTATELGYVSGVTSALQTQMDLKAPLASPTFSGSITTAITASRALVTNGSSVLAASAVTATELGYVSGVTSAIQTQLNAKATDSLVVHLAGTESITGAKTFSATVAISAASGTTFAVNSTDLFVDSTNGRVGVGTSAPSTAGIGLTVQGTLTVTKNTNDASWNFDQGGIHLGMTTAKAANNTGGEGTIKIFSNDDHASVLQGSLALDTNVTAGLRRVHLECIEQGTAYRDVILNPSGGNAGVGLASTVAAACKWEVFEGSNASGYVESMSINGGSLSNGWERGLTFTGNARATEVARVSAYLTGTERHIRFYTAGSQVAAFDNTATAGNTAMLLWDVNKGALSRVTVGANDSGGAGYKLLRVPN